MKLNMIRHGSGGDGPPLVIAHGLYGSARNWGVLSKRLSDAREVVAVDMRNHGDSSWDPVHDYPAMAADLAETIDALGGEADVLGHSMGGKAAMVLALTAPERVRRLIVADIAPVAYTHSQQPYLDAMKAVDLSAVRRRSDADAMLAEHIGDRALRAFLLQSLAIGQAPAHWRLNLDALAKNMPAIMGFPEIEGSFGGPVIVVSGGASDYVRPEHRALIRTLFPTVAFDEIAEAGHWIHAVAPQEFEAATRRALA